MQLVSPPSRNRWSRARRAPGRRSSRGVALIFVLTTIAILTAIGVDFAYQSRVNFELAAQSRDSLRAHQLAMSGMNLARFLLNMQGQLDKMMANASAGAMGSSIMGVISALLPPVDPTPLLELCTLSRVVQGSACLAALSAKYQPGPATGSTGSTSTTSTTSSGANTANGNQLNNGGVSSGIPVPQLWKVSDKLNSNTIFNFIASFPTPESKKAARTPTGSSDGASGATPIEANFGEFTGTFDLKITDEDQKINVARLGHAVGIQPLMTTLQLKGLWDNPRWDFLFNEEDHNRDKVSRNDLLVALMDWTDPGQMSHTFDPTLVGGTPPPFTPGGGDKNGPYSRYKPRYKAKNAQFDSLEELHMVHGVSDNLMLAFEDRLTVYSAINGKMNPNTDNLEQLWADIIAVARNPFTDPLLQTPILAQIVMMEINLRRHYLPFIGISSSDFLAILQADGLQLNPQAAQQLLQNQSSTFRVVANGYAGRVKKTLTAIVQYDTGMGQLLYWHEE
jgi:general secretion pathway protein K